MTASPCVSNNLFKVEKWVTFMETDSEFDVKSSKMEKNILCWFPTLFFLTVTISIICPIIIAIIIMSCMFNSVLHKKQIYSSIYILLQGPHNISESEPWIFKTKEITENIKFKACIEGLMMWLEANRSSSCYFKKRYNTLLYLNTTFATTTVAAHKLRFETGNYYGTLCRYTRKNLLIYVRNVSVCAKSMLFYDVPFFLQRSDMIWYVVLAAILTWRHVAP